MMQKIITLIVLCGLLFFLKAQNESSIVFQQGHSDEITHLAFHPKGNLLASCSKDMKINIIDAKTGLINHTLTGHTDEVKYATFTPKEHLVSSSEDELIVWDIEKERAIYVFPYRVFWFPVFCTDPSGNTLFFKEQSGNLYKLDLALVESGAVAERVKYTEDQLSFKQIFHHPKEPILIFREDREVLVWNYETNKTISEIFLENKGELCYLSKDGNYLMIANEYMNWEKWDIYSGDFKGNYQGEKGTDDPAYREHQVIFNQKLSKLGHLKYNREYKVYDLQTGQYLNDAEGLFKEPTSGDDLEILKTVFSPNGNVLVAGTEYRKNGEYKDTYSIRFVDVASGRYMKDLEGYYSNISKIRFSPNGRKLAIASKDEAVKVLNPLNVNSPLTALDSKTRESESLFWSPDSKVLATYSEYGRKGAYLHNLPTLEAKKLSDHFHFQYGIRWGRELVLNEDWTRVGGVNHLHDMASGEILCEYDVRKNFYRKEVGDPSYEDVPKILRPGTNELILLTLVDKFKGVYNLKIVDTKTCSLITQLTIRGTHEQYDIEEKLLDITVSSDGNYAAVSGCSADIIDLRTRKLVHRYEKLPPKDTRYRLEHQFAEMSFSTNSKYLAAAGLDSNVYVFEVATGRLLHKLTSHQGAVVSVHFQPNSEMFASAASDDRIYFWNAKTGAMVAQLSIVGENDFILNTPDNYYFSTKDAIRRAGFKKGKKVYPLQQFDLKYNRPDILLKRLVMASDYRIKMFEEAYHKRLKKYNVNPDQLASIYDGPSLEVKDKFSLPLTTVSDQIKVKLLMSDTKHTLDRLFVKVNDVPVYPDGLKLSKSKSLQKELSIQLNSGLNHIEIGVLNSIGVESIRENFEISYQNNPNTNLYLLSIGCSKYSQGDYNLTYASKDATDIAALMKNSSQFTEIFSKTILDQNATLQAVEKELNQFFGDAKTDDVVMIYYAGHGLLDKEYNYYLATYNIDFTNPSSGGLKYEYLEDVLSTCKARQRFLCIDACHSGEVDKDALKDIHQTTNLLSQNVSARGIGKSTPSVGLMNSWAYMKALFNDVENKSGATIVAAAGGMEYAFESENTKNGLFTYAFKEAIGDKKGDMNSDNKVSVLELQEYVSDRVFQLSKGKQMPTSRSVNSKNNFALY